MDLFEAIRRFESVERVSNLYPSVGERPLDFLFFLCPKTKGGFRLNRKKTGFTARYTAGEPPSTKDRLHRVEAFRQEAERVGMVFALKAIFASADARILFPVPVPPPPLPHLACDLVSNYEFVKQRFDVFIELYETEPWLKVPARFPEAEIARLRALFPKSTPSNVFEDFVSRVFAGFALDGILIRAGYFGPNPVILGVESPGVTVLQNAALPRKDWLPVVQLR